jgi:hypothetical protein
MPDRYSYSSPWAGGNQPWFRVGQLDVTTTVAVIGLGVISMLIWAIEGVERTFSRQLYLIPEEFGIGSVLEGQVWRLITWPIPNEPDIWTILLFAIFYMLGNQLENLIGRTQFLWFLVALTVFPALLVTLFDAISTNGPADIIFGLRFVQLGVLLAFVAQYPTARFWPGIPAWILGAVVVGLDFLQYLGNRSDLGLVALFTTVVVSLVGIRSFGHAEELPWVPRIALPSFVTGENRPSRPTSSGSGGGGGRSKSRRRKGRSNLSAVPSSPPADALDDMEIDALLDQVAEQGLDSLTKDQRKRLEEHSKRLRKKRDG